MCFRTYCCKSSRTALVSPSSLCQQMLDSIVSNSPLTRPVANVLTFDLTQQSQEIRSTAALPRAQSGPIRSANAPVHSVYILMYKGFFIRRPRKHRSTS
jgi:hypothetical protein